MNLGYSSRVKSALEHIIVCLGLLEIPITTTHREEGVEHRRYTSCVIPGPLSQMRITTNWEASRVWATLWEPTSTEENVELSARGGLEIGDFSSSAYPTEVRIAIARGVFWLLRVSIAFASKFTNTWFSWPT